MSNRLHPTVNKSSDNIFRLKPLVAGVRVVMAGSLFVGSVAPVQAELPVPGVAATATRAAMPWLGSGDASWSKTPDDKTMNIHQHSDKAILNWQSFNVGRNNTVNFIQEKGSSSIALNRIYQEDPSRILGHINSNGQVYLVNKNGFVFGKDSVVDTRGLVASTLNISDDAFERGLTNVFNEDGKAAFGERPDAGDPDTEVNKSSFIRFEKGLKTDDEGRLIDNNGQVVLDKAQQPILVEQGFETNAKGQLIDVNGKVVLDKAGKPIMPVAVRAQAHVGKNGRIIIVAPTIENNGSLSTNTQGQIIMAASQDKVYLQATDAESPFAGLLVEVDTGGKATNAGDILVRQGNVTLAGFAVNQQGRINATTSVSVNGSIRLLAQEQHGKKSAKLVGTKTDRETDLNDGLGTIAKTTFAKGSVTTIEADAEGGSAIDDQAQPQSYMEVTGNTVAVKAGATIKLPGGKVDIKATDNLADPTQGAKGKIHVDNKALIDVSGYKNVKVDMARNVGEISVQSYELRDAPEQRDGVLKGKTIHVDLRKGSDIVDTSGAKSRIERGVEERMGKGGEINLTSNGEVIVNQGAKLDISGGSIQYQDGYLKTTKLLTDYGKVVDISDANPNEHFATVYGEVKEEHGKWGGDAKKVWSTLDQFGQGDFERGYVEGKDAGSVNIKATNVAWNGDLAAGSTAGRYQRAMADRPFGGSFNIDLAVLQSIQNVQFQTEGNHLNLDLDQVFPKGDNQQAVDLILPVAALNKSGVEDISVKTWGDATVGKDARIVMRPGGSLSVEAANIQVDGQVKAAGGAVNLKALYNSKAPNAGRLEMGSKAVLDVSGLWVNDLQKGQTATPTDALAIAGGKVNMQSQDDLVINAGATIRADGGAWLPLSGRVKAGKGGDITLAAVGSGSEASKLVLAGQLSAYGLTQNGGLTLESGKILVGQPAAGDDVSQALVLGITNGNFDFSRNLAFSRIKLLADFDGLTVKAGTDLNLRQKNFELQPAYLNAASGTSMREVARITELPEHLRQPLQLTLNGLSGVTVEAGSAIRVDKGSTIGLQSEVGSIFVDGRLQADAGRIDLTIKPLAGLEYDDKQTIWIGEHAKLLAKGTTRLNPVDVFGRRTGEVLSGGDIVFDAQRGAVVLAAGSLLDVSGSKAQLDIAKEKNIGVEYVSQAIASDAGKVKITAAEGIVLDGDMRATAGSPAAHGGKLEVALDRSKRQPPDGPQIPFSSNPLVINITQAAKPLLTADNKFGDVFPDALNGQATLSADKVAAAGFTDLSLTTTDDVVFVGDVNLTAGERISIDAARINAVGLNGGDAGNVNLSTTFLRMGSSMNRTLADTAQTGTGHLSANAKWIQLNGASQWNGFNRIDLNSAHDIRTIGLRLDDEQRDYVGGMVTAADLHLQASQIYPSTLTDFTFAVKNNPDGQIVITRSANSDVSPLSAGGTLTFEAPVIEQQGVIRAPLGTIELLAGSKLTLGDGSLTSVSADGKVIPFGVMQGGLDWLYPLDSLRNLVFTGAPEKHLVMSAAEIVDQKGSVVDISGGGDLLAYEFQPGAGGSFDYLLPGSKSYEGGFAVVPALGSQLAPYDHYESKGWSYAPGDLVHLSGGAGLPAGDYAILPAHYALLPGAFLVTPQAGTQDLSATRYNAAGLPIVAGYMAQAGTGLKDARTSGFRIESRDEVLKHSQFDIKTANQFYTQLAKKNDTAIPSLPMDGGQISLIAQTRLIMEGQFMTDALTGGKGAKMDISADSIAVVGQLSDTVSDGTLEILSGDLNALHVDSLLLGGSRSRNKINLGETDVAVTAKQVVFSENTHLQGADIMAVATDRVDVQAGAVLDANRQGGNADSVLNVKGDGALLRVSGSSQVVLSRTDTAGDKGDLNVDSGAALIAGKSMLLDASHSTQLLGDIQMQGGSLNLSANNVNIGEVDGLGGNALNLSNAKLTNLTVDELVLTGRDSIGVYGNVGKVGANGQLLTDDNGLPQAIKYDRLVLNTAGLTGHGVANDKARLEAGSIEIQNTANAVNQQLADGQGQLDLSANSVKIGDGSFGIQGFSTVNIRAVDEFRAVGKGSLDVGADLNLATALLTADGGSRVKLNADGHQANFSRLTSTAAASSGYGGAIEVKAGTIDFNTKATLASGSLSLHATAAKGGVTLGEQANVDLAGRAVKFADKTEYTSGGHFSAEADHGTVAMAAGSKVDVSSGGGKAAGGSLNLTAAEQTLVLQGQIKATGGSAVLDSGNFDASANFDSLMKKLSDAGIDQSIYFRSRNVDIVQGSDSSISAKNVTLVADKGAMDLAGAIHADGSDQGGSIQLYAGDGISLVSGANLTAKGTSVGAKGGKVLLSSVDNDDDGISGIDIQNGAHVAVSGNGGTNGEVTLRALRTANGVNIKPIAAGSVSGYSKFYAEGVKKYSNTYLSANNDSAHADLVSDGQINTADINRIKTETSTYMSAANMSAVSALAEGMRLTPGVEIDYSGDLTLKDAWDLADWRYGEVVDSNVWNDLPGGLTIRISGNFIAEKSLSDGFKTGNYTFSGITAPIKIVDRLQGGESWSYNLVAGADAASADSIAVKQAGNLTIGSNAAIRTGSGNMALKAGGDITFTDGSSSVYNAGRTSETSPYGSLKERFVGLLFYSEYPVAGGDLALMAGGNINGAAGNTNFNDWLLRIGNWTDTVSHTGQRPTAWGAALGYVATASSGNPAKSTKPLFQQNVGSFGGGNVTVKAGGNISNLDVMMPTTGKQVGTADNSTAASLNFLSNQVEVNGGGNMQVTAGGDIAGGNYYLGKGTGSMTAGGQVTGGSVLSKGPELLIGDTRFTVNAGSGVAITGVSDPMILHKADVNFFSYSADSLLNVGSLSGDVRLGADGSLYPKTNTNSNQQALARIYPASLHASAFGGSIALTESINMFPGANAELSLFADRNISADIGIRLGMSDGDRSLMPYPEKPLARSNMRETVGRIDPFRGDPKLSHATVPVHGNDSQPVRLVTRQGDIANIGFNLPKKALVESGRDIVNLSLNVQQLNDSDISLVEAARDLRYTSERDPKTGALLDNSAKIEIAGPGDVLVKAGRNVDLGASGGISTVGNVVNTSLAEQGANIAVLAGLNGAPANYADFVSKYQPGTASIQSAIDIVKAMPDSEDKTYLLAKLDSLIKLSADGLKEYAVLYGADLQDLRSVLNQPKQLLQTELSALNLQKEKLGNGNKELNAKIKAVKAKIDGIETLSAQIDLLENGNKLIAGFMQNYTGNAQLTNAQALAGFKKLAKAETLEIQPQLDKLVTPVLFKEIKHAGTASAGNKSLGNASGYAAIETLFPGNDWKGDLSMFFSKIQTVDGGDINLLVPGGQVNAGLAVSFTGAKPPSELGIVAQRQGSINAMVRDNYQVNTSRTFALDGGDIMIWSSEGDIDAGRGAKSAIAAPPPVVSFDENGNMKIEFPPIVSGSGIRTAASSTGVSGGDVYLFAPKGVIDAGEAGIAGSNVTISATAVLGANNIQVSGVGTGVPAASTGSLAAGLTGTSNMTAGVSQMAESSVSANANANNDKSAMMKNAVLGMLSVEVLGFGE